MGASGPAVGQTCLGDCNGDSMVSVDELIRAVNIALQSAPVSNCAAIEESPGNGVVTVDELVDAVLSSLTMCGTKSPPPTPTFPNTRTPTQVATGVPSNTATPTATQTPAAAICGDSVVAQSLGEQCDNGAMCATGSNEGAACTAQAQCPGGECRPVGGDGCSANCTNETRRPTTLDTSRFCTTEGQPGVPNLDMPCTVNPNGTDSCPEANKPCVSRSGAIAQNVLFPIPVALSGTQGLTTGEPRDTEVRGPGGTLLFKPGEVPIVIKAADVQFNPAPVFPLVCACVKAIPVPGFGPGNSGSGKAGCGAAGLTDVNFKVEQDHNTTPGSPGNSGSAMGLPDDPECDNVESVGPGLTSLACLEGTGALCSEPQNVHIGVCNSPRKLTFFGGQAPRGSVVIFNNTVIGLLQDGGVCTETRENGVCKFADYGPDCQPCTSDDVVTASPNIAPTTSGSAEVFIYDAANNAGFEISADPGVTCFGSPCVAKVQGETVDCDAIEEGGPNARLSGILATAFPGLDADQLGDSVTTTTLVAADQ